MSNENVMTVAEAAVYMRISRPTMYALVHRPDFPKIYVGRKILIPRAEFLDWLHREAGGAHASS